MRGSRSTRAEFKNGTLKITGNRIAVSFEDWDHNKDPKNVRMPDEFVVQIAVLKKSPFDMDKELKKAFLTSDETFPENLPPHWRRFLQCQLTPSTDDCTGKVTGSGIVKVGDGVLEPKLKREQTPRYSNPARQARLEGRVDLRIAVDTKGAVSRVDVVRPLGLGLDDRAVEAIKNWVFEPGTRDGSPVGVLVERHNKFLAPTVKIAFRRIASKSKEYIVKVVVERALGSPSFIPSRCPQTSRRISSHNHSFPSRSTFGASPR